MSVDHAAVIGQAWWMKFDGSWAGIQWSSCERIQQNEKTLLVQKVLVLCKCYNMHIINIYHIYQPLFYLATFVELWVRQMLSVRIVQRTEFPLWKGLGFHSCNLEYAGTWYFHRNNFSTSDEFTSFVMSESSYLLSGYNPMLFPNAWENSLRKYFVDFILILGLVKMTLHCDSLASNEFFQGI